MNSLFKEWVTTVLPAGVIIGAVIIPGTAYLMIEDEELLSLALPIWEQVLWGTVHGAVLAVIMGGVMWLGSKSEPRISMPRSDYERLLKEARREETTT